MDEEELICALKSAKEEGFLYLVESYKRKVIGLCYSYTKDFQEAEDLSQEVFIGIYKNINGFRGDCALSTFIYRVAVSRCLDYKRKKSLRTFLTGLVQMQHHQAQVSQDLDENSFLRQCIHSLKEEHKLPILLHFHIGLEYKEIAQVLNLSPKAVEGRIYRAKQALKSKLEEGGYEGCRTEIDLKTL